ncbi:MAG: PspC domain-containing protein [Candidatus Cloacimonetes bacterium]|nr:PspC domain-containing protein [Candidatus Cloacimonadota bacterium]MBL7086430.1 PspC domain-containing protein [Candidatus Cloacimonadota bacterium]
MKVKKKLYRELKKQKIAGVCSGFAEYFDIDVSIVRIIWVLLTIMGGAGIITYIIAILIIPKKPDDYVEIVVEENKEKKKLTLSKEDRVILGVCGGLAEYYEIDPILIRVIFVFMILSIGFGILLYLLLALVIPKKKLV